MNENGIDATPGVGLVRAPWAGPDLWYWLCVECEDAFGPLTGRDGAEVGARAHRHRDERE